MDQLSVVIPCYNNEAHVGATIESALGQSRAPDEIVVVDDGSTDDSLGRIEEFGGRVRLIRQENRGAGAARNAGIAVASGGIVGFLDADDVWPADSLAVRIDALERSGADLVFGRVVQCATGAGPGAALRGPALVGRIPGSMLVRRALFDTVGGFDESLRTAEMIDWIARAEAAGIRQAACEAVVLYRRIHGGNTMLVRPEVDRTTLAVLRSAIERRRGAAA